MIDPKFYTLFFILLSLIFLFREEIERQRTAVRMRKLQEEGKTDQARADLARLAVTNGLTTEHRTLSGSRLG